MPIAEANSAVAVWGNWSAWVTHPEIVGSSKEGGRVNRPGFTSGAIHIPGKGGKDCAIPDSP
jgi:hypothetical protein